MDYSNLSKEQIINGIKEGTIDFKNLSTEQRNDKEIALPAVTKTGWALQFISENLKDDKNIIITAVEKNVSTLRYASDRLRDDKEVVFKAVKQDGFYLFYASDRLQNDKEFLEILEAKDSAIFYKSSYQRWYDERMEALSNLRKQEEKEFMEKSIPLSQKIANKRKF